MTLLRRILAFQARLKGGNGGGVDVSEWQPRWFEAMLDTPSHRSLRHMCPHLHPTAILKCCAAEAVRDMLAEQVLQVLCSFHIMPLSPWLVVGIGSSCTDSSDSRMLTASMALPMARVHFSREASQGASSPSSMLSWNSHGATQCPPQLGIAEVQPS